MKEFLAPGNGAALKFSEGPLSQETLETLHELGEVFKEIHQRLVSEGYTIRDGIIFPPEVISETHHGVNQ
jgi:hypothetical protein